MKQISIEMPMVSECSVGECAYNADSKCHARAITVGHDVHPGCDTYFSTAASPQAHTKNHSRTAGVGACKVGQCRHNDDFECMADAISVGRASDEVNCLTFAPH